MLALTEDDAEKLRQLRERRGYTAQLVPVDNGKGYFYIIQLIPDLLPSRVKLGFASNVSNRLNDHRTTCPSAELLASWPCKFVWEAAAIASITREGCMVVANEIYDCDDLETLVTCGHQFFDLMPLPCPVVQS